MQPSFVFLTALVAAVSATPLPQAAPPAADRFHEAVPAGGNGGTPFSDLGRLKELTNIPNITIFGGRAAVAIHQVYLFSQPDYDNGPYSSHYGGNDGLGGAPLNLRPDEFINYMEIETGDWVTERNPDGTVAASIELVHCIRVGTNQNRLGDLGTSEVGRSLTRYYPPTENSRIVGFNGKSNTVIDQLGPIWA